MSNTSQETNAAIIAANLVALHARLQHALAEVKEAQRALVLNQQNLAIGTILEIEHFLPECAALCRTIILLHRSRDRFEASEVQS